MWRRRRFVAATVLVSVVSPVVERTALAESTSSSLMDKIGFASARSLGIRNHNSFYSSAAVDAYRSKAVSSLSLSTLRGGSGAININNHSKNTTTVLLDADEDEAVESVSTRSTTSSSEMSTNNNNGDDPWIPMGGGAVNEKKRLFGYRDEATKVTAAALSSDGSAKTSSSSFDPMVHRSQLFHVIEGMDRYPNYLGRWSDASDVDRLERALEQQLTKVRTQRRLIEERRKAMAELVRELRESEESDWSDLLDSPKNWEELQHRNILDPRFGKALFGSRMFKRTSVDSSAPTLAEVLDGSSQVELDVHQLTDLMDEECPDVFSLRLLDVRFCKRLCDYVQAIAKERRSRAEEELQHVGRHPVNLDDVGLSWLNDLLFQLVMRPISRHLFRSTELMDGELDWRHGFVAGYSAEPTLGKPRERLVTHTDDSEVTLNLCLGDDSFEGGLVQFRGLRGTLNAADSRSEYTAADTFQPEPGLALLHAGRRFHDVTKVTKGDRYALIMWSRSWRSARSQTCPCCWLNRRTDGSCTCGPRWN